MVKGKTYRSFEEIDRELKILRLKRKIDEEAIAYHLGRAKAGLRPESLLAEAGSHVQIALLAALIKPLRQVFPKKDSPSAPER